MLIVVLVFACVCWAAPPSSMDWSNQYYLNNPPAVATSGAHLVAADGFNSISLPNDVTLFTYFDTLYGFFNYTDKSNPLRYEYPIGFSHSSYSKATIQDGQWKTNFSNTPGSPVLDPKVNNNWYWPRDGVYVTPLFHLLVDQIFLKDNGEYFNLTQWLIIDNVQDDPKTWHVLRTVVASEIGLDGFTSFGDDGSGTVYIFGQKNSTRLVASMQKSDLAKGVLTNRKCWTGNGQWTASCENLRPIYTYSEYLVKDIGNERWNPYLKQWINAFTIDCDLRLWRSSSVTGAWSLSDSFWTPKDFGLNPQIFCYQPNLHPTLSSTSSEITASVCTWDFTANSPYETHIYYRNSPKSAPEGDLWIYLPFVIKLDLS